MLFKAKKLRGVELGSFVVLNQNVKTHAHKHTEKAYEANKFMDLGYVVDVNPMGTKEYCIVIPVVYDINDPWQRRNQKRIIGRGVKYMFRKKDLTCVTINPFRWMNDALGNTHVSRNNTRLINQKYKLKGKLEIDESLWEGK